MLFNAALWYMKHSVKFAALDEYAFVACLLIIHFSLLFVAGDCNDGTCLLHNCIQVSYITVKLWNLTLDISRP